LNSKELWKCNQCHACVSHCPQDVRFADVLRALRELAAEQGYADKDLPARIEELDIEARKLRLSKIDELLG
jgi:heterodisulfide reductase subunit C